MRVLVTGGAGYIGCLIVEELINRGHLPVVLDTLNWGRESLKSFMNGITLIEGDCRSSKDLIYALENVDAVIHLAGIVGEPACKVNYKAHYTVNIDATRNVVQCCTDRNLDLISNFIFLSPCSIFNLFTDIVKTLKAHSLKYLFRSRITQDGLVIQ